jgi:hypothetical protein
LKIAWVAWRQTDDRVAIRDEQASIRFAATSAGSM